MYFFVNISDDNKVDVKNLADTCVQFRHDRHLNQTCCCFAQFGYFFCFHSVQSMLQEKVGLYQ